MPRARKMTLAEFKKHAEELFLKANPTATIYKWGKVRRVKYPTGVTGIVGTFKAGNNHIIAKDVLADWDDASGWMVR